METTLEMPIEWRELWSYGVMEVWRYGGMEAWRYGVQELWSYGDDLRQGNRMA